MARFMVMLAFYGVACFPGYRTYQELSFVYDALWNMYRQYTFQNELVVRGHLLVAMAWMIVTVVLGWLGDYFGTSPEERQHIKEIMRQRRDRELQTFIRRRMIT